MHYEVEVKFRCDNLQDPAEKFAALGGAPGETLEQVDVYFRHPVRDFAKTDEAFRLRRVGAKNFMTYKGPKIDATTKTRFERETRLADGDGPFEAAQEIIERLGFAPVATVRKRRDTALLMRNNVSIEAAFDEVDGVGKFVELEAGVDAESEDSERLAKAKFELAELATQLGLHDAERRSYLELLLAPRK